MIHLYNRKLIKDEKLKENYNLHGQRLSPRRLDSQFYAVTPVPNHGTQQLSDDQEGRFPFLH